MTNKRDQQVLQAMKRTSYLSELEFLYVFALRCKGLPCGIGSTFFNLIMDYIDLFFDKEDVSEDLKPYLKLLTQEDVVFVRDRFRERIMQTET